MAPKAAQKAAQKKAAKQKKILAVLAIPMVLALVFAVHTFMGLGSHPAQATPPASTTPAGSGSTGTPVSAGAPISAITPGIAAVQIDSLRSFTALGQKDPFNDNGPNAGAAAPTKPSKPSKPSGNGNGSTNGPPAPLTGGVIAINGRKLALALGAKFGRAPGLNGVSLFRLVKITAKWAVIDVVGTDQHFILQVSQPLTLEQAGGWTYTLVLEPVGSAVPMSVVPTTTTTGGN